MHRTIKPTVDLSHVTSRLTRTYLRDTGTGTYASYIIIGAGSFSLQLAHESPDYPRQQYENEDAGGRKVANLKRSYSGIPTVDHPPGGNGDYTFMTPLKPYKIITI